MGALTTSYKNSVLDYLFGAVALTPPANYRVALTTTVPTLSTPGTEVSGGSYARVVIANNKTTFTNAAAGTLSNAIAISFPPATALWGNVQGVELYDNAGTTRLAFAALTTPKVIDVDDTATFAIGELDLELIGT